MSWIDKNNSCRSRSWFYE